MTIGIIDKRRHYVFLSVLLVLVCLLTACSTVPVTGRQQLALVSSEQLMTMSADQYKTFMSQNKVITGTNESRMVRRVGERISSAVEDYLRRNGESHLLEGYNWEFSLIEDSAINAWAMPGGKVVVYSGMLPVTRNEAGLATVIGHEVSHVIAGHGGERMSQAMLTQLGGMALSAALSEDESRTNQLFMTAYGLGTQVGILLPYSRLQESESDRLGLIFMAIAGYDPREAVEFWQRMAENIEGAAPPQFLSTHPSHGTRIENIKKDLPEAMKYYRSSNKGVQ